MRATSIPISSPPYRIAMEPTPKNLKRALALLRPIIKRLEQEDPDGLTQKIIRHQVALELDLDEDELDDDSTWKKVLKEEVQKIMEDVRFGFLHERAVQKLITICGC